MSKGEELWRKRGELLAYLYGEGAIAPDVGAQTHATEEALGVGGTDFKALLWSLNADGKVVYDAVHVHLTAAGFKEAAEIVAQDRAPLVH
jgi:hypothetical protein